MKPTLMRKRSTLWTPTADVALKDIVDRSVSCFTVVPNSVIDSTEKLHALIMKDLETTPTRCEADIDEKVFNFMHTSS